MDKLLGKMAIDKKNAGSEKRIVLLCSLGATWQDKATVVEDAAIAAAIAADRAAPTPHSNGP